MKRLLRIFGYALFGLGLLLAVRSVDVTLPRTITVPGPDGAPQEAFAAWYYVGYRLSFVHPVKWTRPGGVARSNAAGEIRLPWTIALKSPFDGGLEHAIEMIYVPALHEARRLSDPAEAGRVTWTGRGGDPEAWERSLEALHGFIAYRAVHGARERFGVTSEMADELIGLLRTEYDALIRAHARTPRAMPPDPAHLRYLDDAGRTAWRHKMARDIAEYPLWGPWIERRWAGRIAELESQLAR